MAQKAGVPGYVIIDSIFATHQRRYATNLPERYKSAFSGGVDPAVAAIVAAQFLCLKEPCLTNNVQQLLAQHTADAASKKITSIL